jgi:hypothetical protein
MVSLYSPSQREREREREREMCVCTTPREQLYADFIKTVVHKEDS